MHRGRSSGATKQNDGKQVLVQKNKVDAKRGMTRQGREDQGREGQGSYAAAPLEPRQRGRALLRHGLHRRDVVHSFMAYNQDQVVNREHFAASNVITQGNSINYTPIFGPKT